MILIGLQPEEKALHPPTAFAGFFIFHPFACKLRLRLGLSNKNPRRFCARAFSL
jgi:hypothetical protein